MSTMSKSIILHELPTLFIFTALIAEFPMSKPHTVFADMLSLLRAFKKGAVESLSSQTLKVLERKTTFLCARCNGAGELQQLSPGASRPKTLHNVRLGLT